nr:MAG TPA: hypothetical protein [Caudoviricetes sp.]
MRIYPQTAPPPFCQSQNFSGAFCGISAKL